MWKFFPIAGTIELTPRTGILRQQLLAEHELQLLIVELQLLGELLLFSL